MNNFCDKCDSANRGFILENRLLWKGIIDIYFVISVFQAFSNQTCFNTKNVAVETVPETCSSLSEPVHREQKRK